MQAFSNLNIPLRRERALHLASAFSWCACQWFGAQHRAAVWALAAAGQRNLQSSPKHGLPCTPHTGCPITARRSSSHMLAGKLPACSDVRFSGALGGLPVLPSGSMTPQPLSPVLRTDGLRAFLVLQHPPKLLSTPGC